MNTEDTQPDPLTLARQHVQACKDRFTTASFEFLQAKVGAADRAESALRELTAARVHLLARARKT